MSWIEFDKLLSQFNKKLSSIYLNYPIVINKKAIN